MFTLNGNDWIRALFMAILAPVLVAITVAVGSIINVPHFDAWLVNWGDVGHNLVNTSIIAAYGAFVSYLGKNLLTTNSGKMLGVVGK